MGKRTWAFGLSICSSATAEGAIADSAPFCDSTRMDMPGRFSRDGANVAFTSDRGDGSEVWLAERTGAGLPTRAQPSSLVE